MICDSIATGMSWHDSAIAIVQKHLDVVWQVAVCGTLAGHGCPFDGPTADMQKLGFAPARPWRNVRYLRLVVPQANAPIGWIAWREISVYSPKPAPPHPRKRR